MNVTEMHLAIQQGVDKINSLQADMLLPEELDIELNKSMSRFLNTKYGKNNKYREGFEESQKRIDDLRTLVKENSGSVTFKEQYSNDVWVDKFRLPSDYLYLVNKRSEILKNSYCDILGFTYSNIENVSYFIVPFNNLHNSTEFVTQLIMLADRSNIAVSAASPMDGDFDFSIYTYPADISNLQQDILNSTNWGAGFEWYWEEHGTLSVPGSFIVVVDTASFNSWFNWDSTVTSSASTNLVTTLVGQFSTGTGWEDPANAVSYAQYTDVSLNSKRIAPSGEREYTFNKFVQQDDIYKLLDDPFNTTKPSSPLTTIRGNFIDIYTSAIFIIDRVKITYIRKPKKISVSLGIDCELPEHTHQEIVDMTVGSILEGISDPRYKSHQIEVSKNE